MSGNAIVRTCTQECSEPIEAHVKGFIPKWLNGTLLRNGPGLKEINGQRMGHLFDGLALLHQYEIGDGKVRYRNRFLRSEAYCRAMEAQRLVISELGTRALPDPCKSFFRRYMTYFSMSKINDNATVNFYPIGDKIYATTETPRLWEIDPQSLDAVKRLDMTKYVALNTYSAHPHIERDGVIYNMGSNFVGKGSYKIIKTVPESPFTGLMEVSVLCTIPIRHRLNPSYYHSFLLTEDYIIFIDQAFCISMKTLVKNQITGKSFAGSMRYKPEYKNRFVVVEKKTGKIIPQKYMSDPFVFFHTINAYQDDGHIICDICCFDDGQAWQDIFGEQMIDVIEKTRFGTLADTLFARGCRSKAKRFIIPLNIHDMGDGKNLVQLKSSSASAFVVRKKVFLIPEVLTPAIPFVDLPQIHYFGYNGKKYRYFYATARDETFSIQLMKIDTFLKTALAWEERDHHLSEPIFVPHPNATSEDDGVILSVAISENEENKGFLIFLDGKSFKEIARAEFTSPSPLINDFHGVFLGASHKPLDT